MSSAANRVAASVRTTEGRESRRWLVRRSLFIVAVCALVFSFGLAPAMAEDTTPPVTSLSASPISPNGDNGYYVTTATVTLTRDEPGSTYYQWDATETASWTTYSTPFAASEGVHTLYYYSVDTTGNIETVQSQAFLVDTVAPAASIDSPSQDATVTGSVTVVGTADDGDFARYTLEYGAGKRPLPADADIGGLKHGTWWRQTTESGSPVSGGTLASWDTSVLDNSYHTLRLVVWDTAGNMSVQLRAVKVGNDGRPWLDEVTVDAFDFTSDISADGSLIAFSSDRLGSLDTWLATPSGTLLSAVATNAAEDRHPSFSPDGQSLVFMSDRAGNFDIWKSNLDGTGLVQLTSDLANETAPIWSHNGAKIVYASDVGGNRDIYIMNAEGSGQTALTSDPGDDWLPDISPDGTKVAFHSDRYGTRDIFIIDADGTDLTRVTSFSSQDMHPSFSPDGTKIAFHRGTSGLAEVWTMNVDGTDPRRLTNDPAPDVLPTWSADGSKIVFASGRSGLCDIYSMDADGANQQRVTFSVSDAAPDVDDESARVAFTSNRARNYTAVGFPSEGDTYLVDADGTDMSLFTDPSSHTHHPSFSPDGQQLAFVSDMGGNWDAWKMGLDGTGLTQLTVSAGSESLPSWGPDGRIVYVSNTGVSDDIFIMDQDGTAQSAVVTDTAMNRFPDITADGSKVGFSSDKLGPGDVFTVAPDGSGLTRLTPDSAATERHPSFGPNGSELTFDSDTEGNRDLYRIGLDGSALTRLTYDIALDTVNTWSADGRTLVFSTSRTTGVSNGYSVWKMSVEPDAAIEDTTPPVTSLSVSPSSPNGDNGYYVTTATVTLTRDEPGSTYYQWDATETASWLAYSTPFAASEGVHTLYYYSVDSADNTETVRSQLLKVDTVAPAASIDSPSQDATVTGSVTVVGTADDGDFARYTLEYGAGMRPLPADPDIGTLKHGTWWRPIVDSASPVSGGTLASWDTSALDNSYHTLRLVVWDAAGNMSVSVRAVKVGNAGRPWLDEVTVDSFDYIPDISADSSLIAFSSDRLGNFDNWIATSDGTLVSAVSTSTAEDRHPSFSPDRQSVVFMSDRAGNFDIWKSNLDGTGLVQLTSGPANESVPIWSHDGSKIVYVSDAAGNRDICIMGANGSGQTALTSDPGDDWLPDISPDGTKVAFHSDRYGTRDLFVVNADGTGLVRVTSLPNSEMHPSFSPDGQKLAFMRGAFGGIDIWTVNVDGTDYRKLTDDPAPDVVPTWSSDGSKIVFASGRSGLCDIYSMDADGSDQQPVTFSVDDFVPDVNNDSSKIVFSSNRARNYTNLGPGFYQGDAYLVDSDGTDLTLLNDLSSYAHHPSFSPDGQQITFMSDASGYWDIWKMGLNGTGLTQLTTGAGVEWLPTWGPSGKIVYASDAPGNDDDIFIMDQDGTAQTTVTTDTAAEGVPDITTDGQTVGFGSDKYGSGDVFTIRPDGTGLTQLTTDTVANESHPSFGPNGSELTFTKAGANTDIYRMGLDGSGLTRLTYDAAADAVNTWSADGRTVVFVTSRTTGDANRRSVWKMTVEPDAAAEDTASPVTSLSISPISPNGDNGYYVTTATVTLTRDEPGATYYQWDATETASWLSYSTPFAASEGAHTLYYYSVDSADNTETVQSATLKTDVTPPTSQGPLSAAVRGTSGVAVAWAPYTDAGSGVASYQVRDAESILATTTSTSASLSGLTEGETYSVSVRAIDAAGNPSAESNVAIITPQPPTGVVTAATPETWEQVASGGWGSPGSAVSHTSLIHSRGSTTFDGRLYVPKVDDVSGFEIHRTADGRNWEQSGTDGFGSAANVSVNAMAEFGGRLYAGTANPSQGCQVWRTSDGVAWSQVAAGGFGAVTNREVKRLQVFDGYLYAMVTNFSSGVEVWRTSDGTTWSEVSTPGFGDSQTRFAWASVVFGSQMYVGTMNVSVGGAVWRTTDGTNWERVSADGLGSAANEGIFTLVEYGGILYAGTRNLVNGTEVWRSPDGTTWSLVLAGGLGSAADFLSPAAVVHEGNLYWAVRNDSTGAVVLRTTDGVDWSQVNADGFGNAANLGTPGLVSFQGALFAATLNNAQGPEVWALGLAQPDTTPPVTSISRTPANPDGSNGWYRTAPLVTLTATEAAATYYQLDSTSTVGWSVYTTPLTPPEGEHRVYYFSVDSAENTETIRQSPVLKVDESAPGTSAASLTGKSSSTVSLAWTAASDAVSGVYGYRVYNAGSGALLATTASLSKTVMGLDPGTAYALEVKAVDAAGNLSAASNQIQVTTDDVDNVAVDVGTNVVAATPGGVELVFDNVTSAGTVSFTRLPVSAHDAPANFQLLGGSHYDISTTSSFDGFITVVVPYDDTHIAGPEEDLKLFHWENGSWEDVTVSFDPVANTITGRVASLSPFSVGYPAGAESPSSTPASSWWSLLALAGLGAGAINSKRRKAMR